MEESASQQYEDKITSLYKEIQNLKEENKKYKERKRYGLVWEDEKQKEQIVEDCKNKLPILERVKEKEIIMDKDKPMNIMVEGDNYHALTCLNYTHRGKIDVIYIDPPYNTGNTDFIYNDKFIDNEDTFKHSKWLSFMDVRLRLARNLLSDNGFVFISIDNNEMANLKLLCDTLFEEKNFISILHIEMSTTQGMKVNSAQKGEIVKNGEYVIVYAKNKKISTLKKILYTQKEWDAHYNIFYDKQENIKMSVFEYIKQNKKKANIPDVFLAKDIAKHYVDNETFREYIHSISESIYQDAMCDIHMNLSKEEIKRLDNGDYVEYKSYLLKKTSTGGIRQLLSLSKAIGSTDDFYKFTGLRKIRGDWWKDFYKDMMNLNKEGNVKFKNGKKPIRLIRDIIKISTTPNSTVLDFFAGSGTTGEAVLRLNEEDGGNRNFILCTYNEESGTNIKIADDFCYPRVKRALNSKRGNLHYFKADTNSFISVKNTKNVSDDKKLELTLKAGELIAIKENIFDEIDHTDYWQIFEDKERQVAIYFTEDISKFRMLLEKLNINKRNVVYVFSWGKNILSGSDMGFDNIEIKDIPQPIINIYREIYRG